MQKYLVVLDDIIYQILSKVNKKASTQVKCGAVRTAAYKYASKNSQITMLYLLVQIHPQPPKEDFHFDTCIPEIHLSEKKKGLTTAI